jgi:hypothetical protein
MFLRPAGLAAQRPLPHDRAALERFYRWSDGVGVAELSRLARMVRVWARTSGRAGYQPAVAGRG